MADEEYETRRKKTGFRQQLGLLLWKNFTLKRRSPVVFALEVVIPLVLFIILVLVRRSEEPKRIDITTFSPRALPSTGFVPVFQSFCDAYDEEVFNTTNERLTSFLEAVQHMVEIGISNDNIRAGSLQQLPDIISGMSSKDSGDWRQTASNSAGQDFYNESSMTRLLDTAMNLSNKTSQSFPHSFLDVNETKASLSTILELLKWYNPRIDVNKVLRIWKTVTLVVRSLPQQKCQSLNLLDEKSSSQQLNFTEKFEDLVKFWFTLRPALCATPTEQENTTAANSTDSEQPDKRNITEKLHAEFDAMSSSRKKYLFLLTRLLYGSPKILFAPNNTAAHRIIHKVNETFMFYANVTDYAREWLNISDEMRWKTSTAPQVYGDLLSPLYDTMDKLACAWLSVFNGINLDVFRGFSSEKELETYFLNQQYHDNNSVIAGLVFENLHNSSTELPPHIRYKIRQNATFNPTTKVVRNKLWFPSPGSYNLKYYYFGFVWIQDLVERAIIDLQAGRMVVEPGLLLHRMPYPCWLWGSFIWLIQHVVPLCFMLSWVYPVAMLVQRIVYEKEQRLKEVMKMMGLSNAVHWCAWFISSWVQMTITMTVLTLMMHYGKILPYSNPWIVFLYLQLFALSSVAFSFLISSCFSKAKLAAACAGIFYFLAYIPYIYISIKEDISESGIMSSSLKTAVSLFSTTALGLGGKYFLYYELEGVGCQWDNIMISPRENDQFTLFHVLLMMVIDSVVYFVLAWYIENVHPGTYGLPKPWYFPFTKSYWCYGYTEPDTCSLKQLFGIHKKKGKYFLLDDTDQDAASSSSDHKTHFEEEPVGVRAGVKIRDLTKVFDSSRPPALNKLNLTLFEGQITSFLGHNGAGKTTTMSQLTGLYPATSGTAHIYGNNISRDMDVIRQSLGICPQHNVLFDKLTVEEHLWFYARLKGKETKDISVETSIILRDISLTDKRGYVPGCLSGGMRRKLSVAVAFVGESKTVILDEPTSGVDPYSRRAIWDLLVKYKKGRTILLSTHHMDEAETLGDRIAVLSYGQLKCCGTPLFLKSSLGQGLHLYILKGTDTGPYILPNIEEGKISRNILETVMKYNPSAYIESESSSEIHIILPLVNRQKEMCTYLFECLDKEKDDLCIKSYGIKDSTLEEVFVKVMEEGTGDGIDSKANNCTIPNSERNIEMDCLMQETGQHRTAGSQPFHFIEGNFTRHINHFRALTIKRFTYIRRNRKGIISQIILPAIFVSIAMTVALSAPSFDDLPPITLDPSQYYNVTEPRGNFIPYTNRKTNIKSNSSSKDASPSQILETFHLPSGIGATCVLKSPFNSSFDRDAFLALKNNPHSFELVLKYFNTECQGVFQRGIFLDHYLPDADVIHNTTWFEKADEKANYYPTCQCKADGVGFVCNDGGYSSPPQLEVVTHAKLQDITGTNEHNYYLYTNDEYRLHRYGGLTVGVTFPYVPDSYNSDSKTRDLMKMVAVKENAHVWFNEKGYHSMPVYTNAMNNAILRANLPESKGNPAAYGITLINHPMKKTNDFKDSDYIQGGTDVIMAIFIIIAMSFVPASFAVFLVHERKIKAKHLQFISGVHPLTYWISNYFWDMCNYIIPTVCIIVILLAFDIPTYTSSENFKAVVLLFLLYGWSITPMMYPFTMIFQEPSVAYIFLIVINLFTGITSVQSGFIFQLFSDNDTIMRVRDTVSDVFLIFPNYCLGNGLMEIALNHYKNEFYSHTGQYERLVNPMIWHLTVKKLVVMSISGLVMFLFTILCEYRFFIRKCSSTVKVEPAAEYGDADVESERHRVLYGSGSYGMLRIENLTKVYQTRKLGKIRAVDRLTLSIPPGECFGLLGVNGAGKTSLFKMLTGDIHPTSGNAFLETDSILQNPQEFYKQIGYCPQFDALFDELTPVEQLHLYARLRGVLPRDETKVVNWAIEKLSLCRYKDQLTGTLSGGNKRKLSTAISLIGNPKLIFMDEPTSGMDPYSRRFLWDTIRNLTVEGKSILFTSHSMEECEALCSRLSIMVNGQMKCLGSIQHLKHKYGDGYTISVILKSLDRSHSVQQYLGENIPGCTLCDTRYRTLTFEIKDLGEGLGALFRILEGLVRTGDAEDYSVSQNTLDNVFINFSKQQKELAEELEETATEVNNDNDNGNTFQHDYDEPLILLTARNEQRAITSYDSDEEILLA